MTHESETMPHEPFEFDKQAVHPHQWEEYRMNEIANTRVHDINEVLFKGKISNILPLAPAL